MRQTFSDFEFIIIDGGSTDGSVNVIKEFACRIKYWVNEPDREDYLDMIKIINSVFIEY